MRKREQTVADKVANPVSAAVLPLAKAGKRPIWLATFASLRNKNFRLFSIGLLFSFGAFQMYSLAQNYLVYQITNLAKTIGYVNAATGLSVTVFSFVGGIAADRLPRRNLLVSTQLSIAVFSLLLGVLISMKLIQVWHIVVIAVAIGVVFSFNMPARQSYVSELVGTENITNALAINSSTMNLMQIAGPALAGVLIGMIGVGPLFFINVLAYGLVVVLLFLIPVKGRASAVTSRSVLGNAVDGLRYVRHDQRALNLLLLGIVTTVFGMPYVFFLPVFQKAVFHVGPSGLGLMMSVTGIGAIVGSLVIASLNESQHKGRIMLASGLGFGISLLLFAATANAGNFPASLGMLALVGVTGTAFMTLNNALVQMVTPPEMRGRVIGLFMITFGLSSLGALPMGALVDAIGAPLTLGFFGAITLGFIIVMTMVRPTLRRL